MTFFYNLRQSTVGTGKTGKEKPTTGNGNLESPILVWTDSKLFKAEYSWKTGIGLI